MAAVVAAIAADRPSCVLGGAAAAVIAIAAEVLGCDLGGAAAGYRQILDPARAAPRGRDDLRVTAPGRLPSLQPGTGTTRVGIVFSGLWSGVRYGY